MADQGLKYLDVKDLKSVELDDDYARIFQSFNEQVKLLREAVLRLDEKKRHNSGTWKTLKKEVEELVRKANGISDMFEKVEAKKQLGKIKWKAAIFDFKSGEANKMIQDFKNKMASEKMADLVGQSKPVGKLPPEKFQHYGGVRKPKQRQEEHVEQVGLLDSPPGHPDESKPHNSVTALGQGIRKLPPEAFRPYGSVRKSEQTQEEHVEQVGRLDSPPVHPDEIKRHNRGTSEANEVRPLETNGVGQASPPPPPSQASGEKQDEKQDETAERHNSGTSETNGVGQASPPPPPPSEDDSEEEDAFAFSEKINGRNKEDEQAEWPIEDEENVVMMLISEEPLQGVHFVPIGVERSNLARKVYERSDVKSHFRYRAWVDMSKANTMTDVMRTIKQEVKGRWESKTDDVDSELELEIVELSYFVRWRRCLFVLDNLSREEDFDELKRCLSSEKVTFPCRVLVTSLNEEVAQYVHDKTLPPEPQLPDEEESSKLLYEEKSEKLLDEKKSWELFWKVVLKSQSDKEVPPSKEMEDVARKLVASCHGLSEAIKKLGTLLSAKERNIRVWKEVLANVNEHMDGSTRKHLEEILEERYTNLPANLKPIFLYFGLFPEDIDIQRDRLFRLWVAEGFSTTEEDCRNYFKELMARNLIQAGKSNGEPESFFISRFSLNFARSKGKSPNNITPQSFLKGNDYSGRVALHNNCNAHIMVEETSYWSSSRPYSLLCFTKMSKLLSRCGDHKTLKVLDLENADLNNATLPGGIRRLTNLKYLSLGGKHLTDLPTWVGKLSSLQTLNLCKSGIESLPIEILELKELRHLLCNSKSWTWISKDFIYKSAIGSRLRVSPRQHIHELKDLQTLWLHTGDWIRDGLEELTQLRELRVIGREGFMQRFEDALSQALLKLELLEVLHLEELGRGRRISLPSFQTHGKLCDITILGVIEKLPDLPQRLTRLRLGYISLTEETKTTLQELPELKDLTLDWHAHDGKEMNCSAGGFPTLECLTLNYFDPRMNYFDPSRVKCIPDGLKNFDPSRVNCIPGGLKNIKKLKELALFMPQEFLKKVKHGGKDWTKIEVIRINGSKEVENTQEKHGVPSSSIRSD